MSKTHYLALSSIPGIGGATARKLLDRFGSLAAAFAADEDDLLAIPRITPDSVRVMQEADMDALEAQIEAMDEQGVRILTWEDDDYPANLLQTHDSPYLLYVLGDLIATDARAAAVIGSRDCSQRCRELAESFSRQLAQEGVAVVSGLAQGIDTAAHRGALASEESRTLAVLGCGLSAIHPRDNVQLAEEISRHGAILTEYAPNVTVRGPQLMARDRIISGLSRAIVVVEAQLQSGSVDTAERARKQGRAVFAVPGSPGTDALIGSGAISLDPASGVVDVIESLACSPEQPKPVQPGLWDA